MSSMKWPVRVEARTHDERGRVLRLSRTVEGAGDVEAAMLAAVLDHPVPPPSWGAKSSQSHPSGSGFRGCSMFGGALLSRAPRRSEAVRDPPRVVVGPKGRCADAPPALFRVFGLCDGGLHRFYGRKAKAGY